MRFLYLLLATGLGAGWYIYALRADNRMRPRFEAEGAASPGRLAMQKTIVRLYRGLKWAGVVVAFAAVALYPFPLEEDAYYAVVMILGSSIALLCLGIGFASILRVRRKYGPEAIKEPFVPDPRPRLEADHAVNTPRPGPALNDQATKRGMTRYWRGTAGLGLAGLVLLAPTVAAIEYYDGNPPGALNAILVLTFAWSGVVIFAASYAIVRAIRMRSLLSREPWVDRRCRFGRVPMGSSDGGVLLLLHDDGTDDSVLTLSTVRWRANALAECDRRSVWIAGDPRHWVVVTAPGVGILQVARRPRWRWWRERVLKLLKEKLGEE